MGGGGLGGGGVWGREETAELIMSLLHAVGQRAAYTLTHAQ